jgi:hypothetical protein
VRGFCGKHVFINLDTVMFQAGEEIVQVLRRMVFGREYAIHFVGEQISALFTGGDEAAKLVIFFLGHKHEDFSPSSHYPTEPGLPQNRSGAQIGQGSAARMTGKTMNGLQP